MTNKELRRLGRRELLEILLTLSRENEALTQKVEQLQKELDVRSVAMKESGTLAEAALKLNGVFEAAQAACDQYCESYKRRMELETQLKCEGLLAQAQARAEALRQQAEQDIQVCNEN